MVHRKCGKTTRFEKPASFPIFFFVLNVLFLLFLNLLFFLVLFLIPYLLFLNLLFFLVLCLLSGLSPSRLPPTRVIDSLLPSRILGHEGHKKEVISGSRMACVGFPSPLIHKSLFCSCFFILFFSIPVLLRLLNKQTKNLMDFSSTIL